MGCASFATEGNLRHAMELYTRCDFAGAAFAAEDAIRTAKPQSDEQATAILILGAAHSQMGIRSEAAALYLERANSPSGVSLDPALSDARKNCETSQPAV